MQPSERRLDSSESRHDVQLRLTSREKTDAVLRLLKGESLQALSQEIGVSATRIDRWKGSFVAAGTAELARRKDVSSKSWVTKNLGVIRQWSWLLFALIAVISILVMLKERSGLE
jgi:hypothetical protein